MDLKGVQERVLEIIGNTFEVTEVPKDGYSEAKYPKFPPVMRFHIRRFEVREFGHLFIMHTETKLGMELMTVSLVPSSGKNVPYLLIDMMSMKNKDTVMVEYYDCTDGKTAAEAFERVKAEYASVASYTEDPAWYIKERTPYSLIKRGDSDAMVKMAYDSIEAYVKTAKEAQSDQGNIERLKAFRERMISEGNPATEITQKLFGKDGAAEFFRTCVFKV